MAQKSLNNLDMKKNSSKLNPSTLLTLFSVISLIGLGLSFVLSQHYFEIREGAASFKSFCNIGTAFNCDSIAASRYAEILPGFPLSAFAGGWIAALFMVSLWARAYERRSLAVKALWYGSIWSSFCSIGYFLVMAFVLKTFCLLCIGVDLVSFSMLALSGILYFGEKRMQPVSAVPVSSQEKKTAAEQIKSLAITSVITLLVVVFGLKVMLSAPLDRSGIELAIQSVMASPVQAVQSGPEFPSLGASAENAKVTIVEFSDFQCPHCKHGALIMKSLLMKFGDKLRVVHRNYPLDPTCNKKMPAGGGHKVACEAARASFCAQKLNIFEPVFEGLFENQETLGNGTNGKPSDIAKKVGALSSSEVELKFNECINSAEAVSAVDRDLAEGDTLGIQSTPTFFINGRKVEGAYPLPVWEALIQK